MGTNKNIFTIKHNDLKPGKGSILISEPFLQDIYFQRSVVLLIEHSEQGSMGVVLNKPTGLLLNDYFVGLKGIAEIPIFLGGPIHPEKLFFIHKLGDTLPGSIHIKDNLYFGGDFDALQAYIRQGCPYRNKVKFVMGYSGWEDGQLVNEIKENSWIVSHQSSRDMMEAEGELFWKQSLERLGDKYRTWTQFPKDPTMN